jgi:hypothetical protein
MVNCLGNDKSWSSTNHLTGSSFYCLTRLLPSVQSVAAAVPSGLTVGVALGVSVGVGDFDAVAAAEETTLPFFQSVAISNTIGETSESSLVYLVIPNAAASAFASSA